MAFAARYTSNYRNKFGDTATITIERDGWADPSETLVCSQLEYAYTPERNELFFNGWPLAIRCSFADDIGTTTRLLGLLNAEERQYLVRVNWGIDGQWVGWLKPSQISYGRDKPGATSIVAVGGLSLLDDDGYSNAGAIYTGRESAFAIADRCFEASGFSLTFINTWMDWYARSTGSFEATGFNSLKHLGIDNARFLDDNGDPFTYKEVLLNQIAAGFDLQVWQWASSWWMMQRRRDFDAGANTQNLFTHSKLASGPATDTFFLDIDWSNAFRLDGMTESHQQARVRSSIIYDHGPPETGIIGNASFEDDINGVGGSTDQQWAKVGSTLIDRISGDSTDGSWALTQPAHLNSGAISTVPDDLDAGVYVEQLAGFIEGGVGRQLTVYLDAKIDFIDEPPATNVFYYQVEISIVGSTTTWDVYRDVDGRYKVVDSATTPETHLAFQWNFLFGWQTIQIPIEELHDGSDPTTGRLRIRIHRAVQDNIGQGSAQFNESRFDNVTFEITESTGETAPTATRSSCAIGTSNNVSELRGPTVRFGSGPTSGHVAKLTVIDGAGLEDGDATDFQVGDNYAITPTSNSRDRLFCDERVKMTGIPLGQLSGSIFIGSRLTGPNGYKPHMYLRDQRFGRVVGSFSPGAPSFTVDFSAADNPAGRPDAGFLPGREIVVAGDTYTVSDIVNNEDGTYKITIEETLTGLSDNDLVTQTIYYMPRSLRYVFERREIVGIWDEYYQGPAPDVFAETKILPGSVGASGISTSIGTIIVNTVASEGLTTVADIGALRSLAAGGGGAVYLESVISGKGLGGGFWLADPSDTSTADNTGTVVAGSDGARWKRVGIEGSWRTEWFGACWDGSTDDSSAFQDTIDAAPSGKEIDFPTLNTVINTGLVVDGKSLTFRGENPGFYEDDGRAGYPATSAGTVIKSGASIAVPIFRIQDQTTVDERVTSCRFFDIHFIGNKDAQNQGTATDTSAIDLVGCWNASVVRCQINSFTSDGITIRQQTSGENNHSTGCRIKDCWIAECGGWGLNMTAQSSFVQDCVFNKNETGGLWSQVASVSNYFTGNIASNNTGDGFLIQDFVYTHVDGNTSGQNTGRGIAVQSVALGAGFTVKGNTAFENGSDTGLSVDERSGLSIYGLTESVVSGNTLSTNGGYGLFISTDTSNLSISLNRGLSNDVDFTNFRAQNPEGFYNVLEWSGVVQRDNDASLALQELIDFVPAGATLFFPTGDYLFENPVTVNKGLTFIGEGSPGAGGSIGTYFRADSSLNDAVLKVSTSGFKMRGINLLGSLAGPSNQARGLLVQAGSDECFFAECVFDQFVGDCARIEAGATNLTFSDCRFEDTNNSGLVILGSKVQVRGGYANDCSWYGIHCAGAGEVEISGVALENNFIDGLYVESGQNVTAIGCRAQANGRSGFHVVSGNFHIVQGCRAYANGTNTNYTSTTRAGIWIEGGAKTLVTGNWTGDDDGAALQQYGISTGASISSATILNNIGSGNDAAFYAFDSTTAGDLDIDLTTTFSVNFGTISNADSEVIGSLSFPGARFGDAFIVGIPDGVPSGFFAQAKTTADDTIQIELFNLSGSAQDPDSTGLDWPVHLRRRGGAVAAAPNPPADFDPIIEINLENPNLLSNA